VGAAVWSDPAEIGAGFPDFVSKKDEGDLKGGNLPKQNSGKKQAYCGIELKVVGITLRTIAGQKENPLRKNVRYNFRKYLNLFGLVIAKKNMGERVKLRYSTAD